MLAAYFGASEITDYYKVSEWASDATLATLLNKAVINVARALRKLGIDTSKVYVPKMFDGLEKFQTKTVSADHTSASIQPKGNETRFVAADFAYTSGSNDECTFYIDGSEDDTYFFQIATFIAQENKTYTVDWPEKFKYVRYRVTPGSECTYKPFLVDTAFDEAIRYQACMLAVAPHIDGDGNASTFYEEMKSLYTDELRHPVADYDINADGSITADEKTITRRVTISR